MIPLFPTPYPDELLYSIVARYQFWSRNRSYASSVIDLFKTPSISINVDFPFKIDQLVDSLNLLSDMNSDYFISHHTYFSLIMPFIQKEQQSDILEHLRKGGGKIKNVASVLGANNVKLTNQFLKYCPKCYTADKQKYGEAYWHRTHQLNGISVCPLHEIALINIFWMRQSKIIDINQISVSLTDLQNVPISKWDITFSKMTQWFFDNELSLDIINLKEIYSEQLKCKSLAYPSGVIKHVDLLDALKDYYGLEFLKGLSTIMNVDLSVQLKRLLSLNFTSPPFVHPIIHFLLLVFLEIDLNLLRKDVDYFKYRPFGLGPWPCLNPTSMHYKEHVIPDCEISCSAKDRIKPLGIFRCSCGFEYSRKDANTTKESVYQYSTVIKYGEIWDRSLVDLAHNKRLSFRKLSKKLLISPDLVRKELKRIEEMGIGIPDKYNSFFNTKAHRFNDLDSLKFKYRQSWTELIQRYPDAGRSDLKLLDPKVHRWITKYDNQWYKDITPSAKSSGRKKKNWKDEDNLFYEQLLQAITKMKNSNNKPFRITKHSLSQYMKQCSSDTFIRKLESMPLTKELFFQSIESLEDFQIRRIQYVLRTFIGSGEAITVSKVMVRASLYDGRASKRVLDFVETEVKQHL
ncbi:TnsD family Tn7-like transposition protein [Paenibacillus sp. FSL E2-0201]|uniref:TnsD family Tn7-like transposition protein n=1 Tax=Paenibacillus sp. FSL E2-0201 TaxID=2954726 RepID=UPI0030D814AA